jgi:raffinose/stachyose/melibiose transport system permease protein
MTGALQKKVERVLFPTLLLVILIIQIFPIIWVFISSFKTINEFRIGSPFALPKSLYFGNYINAIVKSDLLVYFKNSLIVVVFVLIGILILSSMAGFALEKLRFRFRKAGLLFFLFGIMVPIQVTLIPLYQIYRSLGLLDTYTSIILPQIGFGLPVSIFLFVAFYKFLPNEVLESALMDGASMYRLYVSIVIPMAKNIFVTVATLYGMTDWGATFSAIMLTVTPTFLLYFFLSKSIISGMTAGAVKS